MSVSETEGVRYIVRIVLDGATEHLIEWWSAYGVEPATIAVNVGRYWLHEASHDLRVEVRRDGEPWSGKRYLVRPVLEAIEQ